MKFPKIFKQKEKSSSESIEQKRFYCENCENEVFLKMKYCDECGGEIEWPKKYNEIREHYNKEEDEIKQTPIAKG